MKMSAARSVFVVLLMCMVVLGTVEKSILRASKFCKAFIDPKLGES